MGVKYGSFLGVSGRWIFLTLNSDGAIHPVKVVIAIDKSTRIRYRIFGGAFCESHLSRAVHNNIKDQFLILN